MIADTVITRLRGAGLQVTDLRGQIPRKNYTWASRSVSSIRRIAVHHDAVDVSRGYSPVARYTSEANYHAYVKVWGYDQSGNPIYGDGIMYAVKVACDGHVYICRDFEDVTWHVGSPNGTALGVCVDGNFVGGNQPFNEQVQALSSVLHVLCFECPEFPATQATVFPHREFVQFGGLSTDCPGNLTQAVDAYRNSGTLSYGQPYEWYGQAPQQAPAPQPAPDPAPAPPQPAQNPLPPVITVRIRDEFDGVRVRLGPATGVVIGEFFKGTEHRVYSLTVTGPDNRPWYKLEQRYSDGREEYIAAWAADQI